MKRSIRQFVHMLLALTLVVGIFDRAMVQAATTEAAVAEASDCCPEDDQHEEEANCLEDCSAGCCASHAPAPATVVQTYHTSDSIQTPLLTGSPEGETCRGFRGRVFQPPRA